MESTIVEVCFHKVFASREVATIYMEELRSWLEANIPTYLWPEGLDVHVESVEEYDARKGQEDHR